MRGTLCCQEKLPNVLSLAFEMMGLGNGRRSMKSPPLLLAALVACIIVLGFNYWIASSRSADLQAALVNNITAGEKLIRTLQDQLKVLQKNYGKLQQDVLQFQKNQTNLERKFSYDLSQCINQMKEVKEQCEERIEEVTRKGLAAASRDLVQQKDQNQKLRASSDPQPGQQEAGLSPKEPQGKEKVPGQGEPHTPAPSSEVAVDLKRQGEKANSVPGTEEANMIQEEEFQRDSLPLLQEAGPRQALDGDRHADRRNVGQAGDFGRTSQVPAVVLASQENQDMEAPERDQLVIQDGQEELHTVEEERNLQRAGGGDDYNLEENEAESETDKQAALTGDDRNINVLNTENQKRNMIHLLDQHGKRNHTQ
ncbi:Golgi membrane protein 1 isoform X5 [Erinaceus europaeus]|uniref:Golgi membrane protein 1 isoform X5 n=1 Tax=Erinaceus europaeus TaxID=9365 RepID=A0ABM3Y322_ERIEU|nr:Golgi membrane protein 1 isoform X5 [Erinaceus europaeus]